MAGTAHGDADTCSTTTSEADLTGSIDLRRFGGSRATGRRQ